MRKTDLMWRADGIKKLMRKQSRTRQVDVWFKVIFEMICGAR